MKFPKGGSKEPLLTLGEKFVPGSDTKHFCKPTSTAVDEEGTFDNKNIFIILLC